MSDQHKPRFVVPVQGGRVRRRRSDDMKGASTAHTRGQRAGEMVGSDEPPEGVDHGADPGETDPGEADPGETDPGEAEPHSA